MSLRVFQPIAQLTAVLGAAICLVFCLRLNTKAADNADRDPSDNGIYIDSVQTYDEATLQQQLTTATNNLQKLNAFDQMTLTKQVGQVQGGSSNQSTNALTINGPGGTASPAQSPTAPSLPSTPAVSSGDFLNEQLQLGLQIINMQLLLGGSLEGQREQGPGIARNRATLGFPIYIRVPQGFKYQGAVAEVEVTVCGPQNTSAYGSPTLVLLLPQEKTYNVASIVSKGTSIGGGSIASVVNAGGSFLRSHQTYYLVQDQDTLAMQRPTRGACVGGRVPITFAWQFRPVLGQKIVRGGLRQTFAQISLPTSETILVNCPSVVRVRTGWRRYDLQTGRVGAPIDPFRERELEVNDVGIATPSSVSALDNGGGTLTVTMRGAFNAGKKVRIGPTVLDESSPGFELADRYIKFKADALSLALYGAVLINKNGLETEIKYDPNGQSLKFNRYLECEAGPPPLISLAVQGKKGPGDPKGQAGQSLELTISGKGSQFMDGNVTFTQPDFFAQGVTDSPVFATSVKVKDADHLIVDLSILPRPFVQLGTYYVTVPTRIGFVKAGSFEVVDSSAHREDPPPADNQSAPWTLKPGEGQRGQTVTLVLTRAAGGFDPSMPPDVKFVNSPVTAGTVTVRDANTISFPVTIPPDAPVSRVDLMLTIPGVGNPVALQGAFVVNIADVVITSYSDTTSLVRLALDAAEQRPTGPSQPDVVVVGTMVYGLRDSPYYERGDDYRSILVPNELLRGAHKIFWKNLVSARKHEYTISFDSPSITGISEFVISSITPISSSGGSGGANAPAAVTSNVTVTTGSVAVTGTALVTIGNGTPSIASISPASGAVGPNPIRVLITGAFTHFTRSSPSVTFSDSNVTAQVVEVDDTHLKIDVSVKAGAQPGPLNVTIQAGPETVVGPGIFTVTKAGTSPAANPTMPSIVAVTPASFLPGETHANVIITAENTQFSAASTVTSSNPGITASNPQFDATKPSQLSVTLNVSSDALSAAAGSSPPAAPAKAANTYAITGSHLTGLEILRPSVEVTPHGDTLATFSLTDDQVKEYKNILVRHGTEYKVQALPASTAAPTPTPPPALKDQAGPINSDSTTPVVVFGNGMNQVVAVKYLDTSLPFTATSDTSLTIQKLPVLTPPGIEVVFEYADKSLKPYKIPVKAPPK